MNEVEPERLNTLWMISGMAKEITCMIDWLDAVQTGRFASHDLELAIEALCQARAALERQPHPCDERKPHEQI